MGSFSTSSLTGPIVKTVQTGLRLNEGELLGHKGEVRSVGVKNHKWKQLSFPSSSPESILEGNQRYSPAKKRKGVLRTDEGCGWLVKRRISYVEAITDGFEN